MLPLFAHSRHIALPPVFVYGFGAIFGKITAIEPPKISRSISDRVDYPPIKLSYFGVSSPVLPGVVPPLNLTAAYRSLWYARFGQGCGIRNGVDQFVTMKIHVLKSLLIRATLLEYLFLGIAKVFAYCRWEDI